MTERRADDATRDVVRWLKCEYIQKHVGEDFDGIISGVTRFGFFVELKDIFIDGLVHVTSLKNDYYYFDQVHHRLVGERSGISFKLGDPVKVRVAKVAIDERKIDFDLIGAPNATKTMKKQKNKTSRRGAQKSVEKPKDKKKKNNKNKPRRRKPKAS
jgi:ribonuclease R